MTTQINENVVTDDLRKFSMLITDDKIILSEGFIPKI